MQASESVVRAITAGENLRLTKEVEAELGRRSTYYLAKHILGFNKLNDNFHVALCRFIDKYIRDVCMILAPRGHYKTTCKTIAGNIRMILNDPNISIMLVVNTMDNAQEILRKLKDPFIGNDKFRSLYHEHATKSKRQEGTYDSFTTPARTQGWKSGGTVDIAGADKAVVSRHYDFIQFDDLVDDKNITTAEQKEKIYRNYVATLSVIDTETSVGYPWHHIIGTRWAYDDLYSKVLEEHNQEKKEGSPGFKIFISQAYKKVKREDGTEKTIFLFPEQFSEKRLESIRKKDEYQFSCLYLNDPTPEERRTLDPRLIQLYNPDLPRQPEPLDKCITVDPARTKERNKGDPSVIAAWSMNHESEIRNIELIRGWFDPDELIKNIIDMHKRLQITKIGIEAVAFQQWLCFFLEKERREKRIYFNITEIKRSSAERKCERQERIIPYHRSHKILWRMDDPELETIYREHREYPNGAFDDILDTLTDAIEMMSPPSIAKKTGPDYFTPPILLGGSRRFHTGYNYRSR